MKKWVQIIGWTVLAMVAYYMIEVLFYILFGYTLQKAERQNGSLYIILANLSLKLVSLFVFGGWYWNREHKGGIRTDYRVSFTVKNVLCLASIGLFGQYVVGFLMALVRMVLPSIFVNYDRMVQAVNLNQGYPVLMLFLVVVLGPIAEEILFRGVIYGKLREGFTLTQAAIISGAIFGIYHKNMVQGIYASLFGIILAYIFEKTKTIWGAVVTHMLFNLSSYFISWLKQLQVALPAYFYFLFHFFCFVVVIGAILALKKQPNRYDGRENELA